MNSLKIIFTIFLALGTFWVNGQEHPEIYINNAQKETFLSRLENSEKARDFIEEMKVDIDPYVDRHKTDPEWIVSRLQMYWKAKYQRVYVNGMDFSHGAGEAPVPTVRFSGSRDWATDYLRPELEDIKPYMDDKRGLYLQNGKKDGKPWEWVHPSETGHIIERINEQIIRLAEEAAFLYWLTGEHKYAVFAHDIFIKYMEGMYHREPPLTFEDHKNKLLMGLQTFEVIHERIVEHLTICYDFLYGYLQDENADLKMIQDVFRKWADQEIKFGVPGNNWNLMQALYITYIALALEDDSFYEDGKGQQYYIDQVLNQNSVKQKALKDVVKNYDQETGVWPEVAGYNMLVANDMLEIFCLMDNTLNNNLLEQYPIIEKANLVIFQYLFPTGLTVAYGDAKHSRIRFNALELLIGQYRKYGETEKETLITQQLKRFTEDDAYNRDKIGSLFQMFFYVEHLMDVPPADSFSGLTSPTFYGPNVSWLVQRNGNSIANGMMISKNASLGNHSHTNGINIELFAKGMVIAPDCAAGVSYWTKDHRDYYSRFAAHNTVVVDGISDYRNMKGSQAFELKAIYPATDASNPLVGDYTFSDVSFIEPSTEATQLRLTGSVRSSESSGYIIDIFRSARNDGKDKKHEYLFHGQGEPIQLQDFSEKQISTAATEELSSAKGDLVGYDYFTNKRGVQFEENFVAQFSMPSLTNGQVHVNLWMKGNEDRSIFTVEAPYSRAINVESVPEAVYHKPLPTLVVRQSGEARKRPFVNIIDAFNEEEGASVTNVEYFSSSSNPSSFIGVVVHSASMRADHIYNDDNSEAENIFDDGRFKGGYGIISFKDNKMHSMFLGNGKLIEKSLWKIETSEKNSAVLITKTNTGFIIDANQKFTLTLPVEKGVKKVFLENGDTAPSQVFIGKVSKKTKQKLVEFELPALNNIHLKIIE